MKEKKGKTFVKSHVIILGKQKKEIVVQDIAERLDVDEQMVREICDECWHNDIIEEYYDVRLVRFHFSKGKAPFVYEEECDADI